MQWENKCLVELKPGVNHRILEVASGLGFQRKYWLSVKIGTPSPKLQLFRLKHAPVTDPYIGDVWINLACLVPPGLQDNPDWILHKFCYWPTFLADEIPWNKIPRSLTYEENLASDVRGSQSRS